MADSLERKAAKESSEGKQRRKAAKESSEGKQRRKAAKESSEGKQRRKAAKESRTSINLSAPPLKHQAFYELPPIRMEKIMPSLKAV
jgi:hypothetical protein